MQAICSVLFIIYLIKKFKVLFLPKDEADRLTTRLAELEERAEHLDRARSEKISSIALINDRNRKRNIEKAEENIKQEIAKKKIEGESCDPFTRQVSLYLFRINKKSSSVPPNF
jgi:hypothetical protein